VAEAFADLSRARVQRLIEDGGVLVAGAVVRKSAVVEEGARIEVTLPATDHDIVPTGLDLPVLYADEHLTAVSKPAGLAVHGAPGDQSPDVARWWLEQLGEAAGAFTVERPGIVHRLDKDTSGVLLLARTPAAQTSLSKAFEDRTTVKTYIAICDGVPGRVRAVIDAAVGRDPRDRARMGVVRNGRASRTAYEMVHSDHDVSILIVKPETGRTHQIRVHLAAVGVPVRFDGVYGKPGAGRQMLHAWQLTVPHPAGGTLTVTAPIPADMAAECRALHAETLALAYSAAAPALRSEAVP